MSDSENVLEIKELKKRFWLVELERALELRFGQMVRPVDAVRNVSMTVQKGQVFGFLGPFIRITSAFFRLKRLLGLK